MLKIPKELISKVEEKGLIHRIPTDMGFRIEHKKGQSLVLYDDNIKLLHLAVDTMKFWTSAQAMSSDSICLLENKKVVWKFYDNYARIIVHFFEDEIDNLTNVYVWRNNHLKRNVSSLELWCNYEHFEAAEPKIETICRGVEDLKHEQIKVKQPDIIKARQFATNLENDKAVLCVYREKDNTLEMYGIHNEHITQAHTEFDKRLVKMTGRGTKATSTTTATGNKGVAEAKLTDSNKGLAKSLMSPNKPNMSIDGTGADSKDQRFATSFGNKEMAEAKSSITPNKPNRSIDGTGADSKDQRFATSFGNKEMAEAKSSITPNKPNMSMCGTDTDSKDQRFARSIGNKEMAEAKSSISPNKPNMSIDGTGPDSKDQRFAKTIANKEMAEAKSSKPPNKPNMSIGGTGADSKDQRFATSIGNKEMAEPKSSISPNKPNMSIVTTGKDSKDQSFARSIGNKAKSSISPNKPNMSIGGTGTDSKDQSFARSIGNKTMAEAQLPDLNNSSAKSEDESMADMAISSKATTKHYSQVLQIKSGSKFLYQFTLGGLKVSVYQHSIIDVKGVDAIVNAANDIMVHGGGVAYYISKAAGKEMDDEGKYFVSKNGKLRVGKNCVTGAERLPYNGIIHAVGPQWADYIGTEDRCAEDLYKTIKNTLRAAKDKKFQRIALCAISAG